MTYKSCCLGAGEVSECKHLWVLCRMQVHSCHRQLPTSTGDQIFSVGYSTVRIQMWWIIINRATHMPHISAARIQKFYLKAYQHLNWKLTNTLPESLRTLYQKAYQHFTRKLTNTSSESLPTRYLKAYQHFTWKLTNTLPESLSTFYLKAYQHFTRKLTNILPESLPTRYLKA